MTQYEKVTEEGSDEIIFGNELYYMANGRVV